MLSNSLLKIKSIFLLVGLLVLNIFSPITNASSVNISDFEIVSLVENHLAKKPTDIYPVSGVLSSLKDSLITEITIIKKGSFKVEKNYFPVRARIQGKVLVHHATHLMTNNGTEEVYYFDKIAEFRMQVNDFDEWEVNIINTKNTKNNTKTKKMSSVAKKFKQTCENPNVGNNTRAHDCFQLAIRYETGKEGAKDKNSTMEYYDKACKLGDNLGCKQRDRAAKNMK